MPTDRQLHFQSPRGSAIGPLPAIRGRYPLRTRAVISLGIVALTAAVFAQVRHHEFVDLDDTFYIVDNPNLREGLSPASIARAFREPYFYNWIPLTSISYQLDYALYGLEPTGYLFTNLALHVASAVLLFLVLSGATGAIWPSAAVAGVFAVHPLHVESVAWASSRKDVLSGLFFMLALGAYVRYAERPTRARYAGVGLSLALGVMAKGTLVTFPFVLLLLDHWPLQRMRRLGPWRCVWEKLPLFALVAATSAITYWVQRDMHAMVAHPPPLAIRVANAIHSYAVYVRQSALPTGLGGFYPYPPGAAAPLPQILIEALLLAAVTAAALTRRHKWPWLTVGWLWYLGTLVPTIGLVQVGFQLRADRYMYLPLIGLALIAAWGTAEWVAARPAARRPVAALWGCAIAALALAAWVQVGTWRDSLAFYERAVAVTQGNFFAHKGIGAAHWSAGRHDEALDHYRESVRLKPDWSTSRSDLGILLLELGRPGEALPHLEAAIRIQPGLVRAHTALGTALVAVGQSERARAHLSTLR